MATPPPLVLQYATKVCPVIDPPPAPYLTPNIPEAPDRTPERDAERRPSLMFVVFVAILAGLSIGFMLDRLAGAIATAYRQVPAGVEATP